MEQRPAREYQEARADRIAWHSDSERAEVLSDAGYDTAVFGKWHLGAEPRRPNLIVILADDLGYGDISIQGGGAIDTPHIDRLASEGVRFTQFYPDCS